MATPAPVPELKGHWLTGTLSNRRVDPIGFFTQLNAMGDLSTTRLLWIRGYSLNTPELIKHVYVDNAANYHKGTGMKFFTPILGMGLFTAEGEFWKKNRRLAQPAFHRQRLAGLVNEMVLATQALLDRWEANPARAPGEPFDAMPDMMALTMSVVARTLFSADVSGRSKDVSDALSYALEETNRRILTFNTLGMMLPTARNRAFARAVQVLDGVVFGIIEERRRNPGQHTDMLQMLMDARDADTGEGMSDRQLRDEAMTLFLAGHETTAVALGWLWYLLSRNPEVEQKVRDEVDAVLGGRPPTAEDLPKLKYTLMTVEETLRLYPPAWVGSREAIGRDEILGQEIRPGTPMIICPWAMHRSPRYWEDPERFDPERFSPERSAGRPKLAYLPFGTGQRMCIGNNFALMEAQVILAMVLQRHRVVVAPGTEVIPAPQVTLRPKDGMPVHLEPAPARRRHEQPAA